MNRKRLVLSLLVSVHFSAFASFCPDPQTTPLQWGEIPSPWMANPFSANTPQGGTNTQFLRANIMVAGYGSGVVCTYRFPLGDYSIWWPVLVKIPARVDYNWIETYMGFVCNQSISTCEFITAG